MDKSKVARFFGPPCILNVNDADIELKHVFVIIQNLNSLKPNTPQSCISILFIFC